MRALLTACMLALALPAAADEAVEIFPRRIILAAGTDDAEAVVVNRAAAPVTVTVGFENLRLDREGHLSRAATAETGEYFADAELVFAPARFTLRPGAAQTVRFLRVAESAAPESRTHVVFRLHSPAGMRAVRIPLLRRSAAAHASGNVSLRGAVQISPDALALTIDVARVGNATLVDTIEGVWRFADGRRAPAFAREVVVYPPSLGRVYRFTIPSHEGARLEIGLRESRRATPTRFEVASYP